MYSGYVLCTVSRYVWYVSTHFDRVCRTHFNYEQSSKNELSFRKGDIFHVVDTLNLGVVGAWQVFRIGEPLGQLLSEEFGREGFLTDYIVGEFVGS